MIEAAWLWRKYQSDNALAKWYEKRATGQSPGIRRIMLVALARKLIVAIWRHVEIGLFPGGAVSRATNGSNVEIRGGVKDQIDALPGRSLVWGRRRRVFVETIGIIDAGKKV
jgi:hypothetical protein